MMAAARCARVVAEPESPMSIPPTDRAAPAALDAARTHHRAGRLAEAAALYRRVLEADPGHAGATHLLGVVAFQQGDHRTGAALIGKAIALEPSCAEYHHDLGDVLRADGRADEAAACYRKAIALDPAFREPRVNLAELLHREGRLAEAVAAYRQALELAPDFADLHYNAANALRESGSPDDAAAHYRRALALQPAHWRALHNLACVLHAQGDTTAAADAYRRALALEPKLAAAHFNLATIHEADGRIDEAIAGYRGAIAARPDDADAHNNLANLLQVGGRGAEALASYRRAIELRPGFAEAHHHLGKLALALGGVDAAIASLRRALALKETPAFKASLAHALAVHPFDRADPELRSLLVRALAETWVRPADLAPAGARLLRADPPAGVAFDRAGASAHGETAPPIAPREMRAAADDPLFAALLTTATVPDAALERWLTRARAALWEIPAAECDAGVLAFAALLARQCLLNDFAFAFAAAEAERANAERARLADALDAGTAFAAFDLARLACYVPLAEVPRAERLLGEPDLPAPLAALLEQAVAAPREEARLREGLVTLTAIDDATSQRVRAQYEAHPYPRWTAAAPVEPARSLDAWLRAELPGAPFAPLHDDGAVDLLIAGCGTGQHALETARRFPRARVLALDLSRASLAYALRMTRAAGVGNVEFAHGDLLALPGTRSFDAIEAVGVLHHLADPGAGWRRLLAVLRPGGLLRVGLYGERAREAIVAGRDYVAQHRFAADADDIRRFRQVALEAPPDSPLARLTALRDFNSIAECRDLLFHVQEHRTTIARIKALLAELGVRFVGFVVPQAVALEYARRFPRDRLRVDLDGWNAFEAAAPGAFPGLYEFWVQKPPAP